MNNRKINLDRPKISSEEIRKRQNFDEILVNLKALNKPFYKKTWFWGTTGLATAALAIAISTQTFKENTPNEENTTLTQSTPLPTEDLEDSPCINPLSVQSDLPYELFNVQSGRDTTLYTEDGSSLQIGEKSFLNVADGAEVQIKVRYFQDKSSVFVAGIPMTVSDGAFESAGMIELRGYHQGKLVDINPKEAVQVNMNMYKNSTGFNFYYLNESKNTWEDSECTYSTNDLGAIESTESSNSPVNVVSNTSIEKVSPREIESKILEIEEEISELKFPKKEEYKLIENKSLVFDLDYSVSEFPEFKELSEVMFEALPDQSQYREIVKEEWDGFELEQISGDEYKIVFNKGRKKNYLLARPILQGEDEKAAEKLFNKVNEDVKQRKVELQKEKRELELRQKSMQAKVDSLIQLQKLEIKKRKEAQKNKELAAQNRRESVSAIYQATASFEAVKWGVYNCDSPKAFPKPMQNRPVFVMNGMNYYPKDVFVFSTQKDARFDYFSRGVGLQAINNIGFHKGDNIVFATNNRGDIAYVKLDRKVIGVSENPTIELTLMPNEDFSVENIKKILGENIEATNNLALR